MITQLTRISKSNERVQRGRQGMELHETETTALLRWQRKENELDDQMKQMENDLELLDQKVENINVLMTRQGTYIDRIQSYTDKRANEVEQVQKKNSILRSHLKSPSKLCCDVILIILVVMLIVMIITEATKM